mmetsp:Transcript_24635/g.93120  ORF Transcript_24635/g.93120 Transcript_24635/m.93120 type:complete len:221 (+) Transcript_24635:495-1157(+)
MPRRSFATPPTGRPLRSAARPRTSAAASWWRRSCLAQALAWQRFAPRLPELLMLLWLAVAAGQRRAAHRRGRWCRTECSDRRSRGQLRPGKMRAVLVTRGVQLAQRQPRQLRPRQAAAMRSPVYPAWPGRTSNGRTGRPPQRQTPTGTSSPAAALAPSTERRCVAWAPWRSRCWIWKAASLPSGSSRWGPSAATSFGRQHTPTWSPSWVWSKTMQLGGSG